VDLSTDEEDIGRPSTSEGKHTTFRFCSLKRTVDHDDERPSGTTSEAVNSQHTPQYDYSQGIVTQNRFSCLSQENNITDGTTPPTQLQQHERDNTQTPTHTPSQKRFARESTPDPQTDEHNNNSQRTTNTREKKLPPIYLTSKVKNYITFAKALKQSVGDNFQLKFLGEQIKIQFFKINDFKDFKKYAIEKNFTFHTYSLPDEKTLTVTLKGLPNIPDLSIQNELAQQGININTCTKINTESSLYATYKINLSAEHTLTHLRKIRYLFHSKVYWDKFINIKRILQCYRCQAFGHTSSNCYKNPRCVKCAQSHLTSTCTKTPDTPAKCCNCSGDHPASYTQCPAYIKFLEKRTQFLPRDNANISNVQNKNLHIKDLNFNNNTRNIETQKVGSFIRKALPSSERNINRHDEKHNPRLYAALLNNNSNNNVPASDDIAELNGLMLEIQRLRQLVDIPHMILVVRNLNIRLANCKDGLEKLQAFIEASESLNRNG